MSGGSRVLMAVLFGALLARCLVLVGDMSQEIETLEGRIVVLEAQMDDEVRDASEGMAVRYGEG